MTASGFAITDPEVRDVMVRRLREHQAASGTYEAGAIQQVADICGVHRSAVYRWCKKGTSRRKSREGWMLDDSCRAAIIEANGNVGAAYDLQRDRDAAVKSRPTFYRAVERDPDTALVPYARLGAQGLLARRVALFAPREGPNQRWEIDHAVLPIEVLLKAGDPKSVTMHLTLVVDCDGGDILAQVVSPPPGPNRGDVLCALRLAIENYGIPNVVACDNGMTFTSGAVRQVAAMMDFRLGTLPPFTPEGKGGVESAIKTIKTRFCRLQPFYTKGARRKDRTLYGDESMRLDAETLVARLNKFVEGHNSVVKVRGLGGRTRAASRAERSGALRWASHEDLRTLTLERQTRTVGHDYGITIDDVKFLDDEGVLQSKVGRKVLVGMMPHDYSRIEVWENGRWICTAKPTKQISEAGQEANRRKRAELNRAKGQLRRLAAAQRARYAPLTPDEPKPRQIGRSAIDPGHPRDAKTSDPLGFGKEIGEVE